MGEKNGDPVHIKGLRDHRLFVMVANVVLNLTILGYYKYWNFFIDSFMVAFSHLGINLNIHSLQVILPVGISFYTFQALSYSIDVYRGNMKPTRDIVAFFAYVSFFPQLVAGPIERAVNLLPQFYKSRVFSYDQAVDGCRQILWGLFKKMVIADRCAVVANQVFNHSDGLSGSTLVLGAVFFAFQIYGDFSGYSDIAIGVSRLFGINLMQNFAFPYFSRDIAEFWRRWHISLSTWFRDYVYIPLGGSRVSKWKQVRNTFIIFIVSGLWHGANWTFVAWGALNALYFLPLLLTQNNRRNLDVVSFGKWLPSVKEVLSMSGTFALTVFAWIFFRADNMTHAFNYIKEILSPSLFEQPHAFGGYNAIITSLFIVFFISFEWSGRSEQYALEKIGLHWNKHLRRLIYYTLTLIIVFFSQQGQTFIYFQF